MEESGRQEALLELRLGHHQSPLTVLHQLEVEQQLQPVVWSGRRVVREKRRHEVPNRLAYSRVEAPSERRPPR